MVTHIKKYLFPYIQLARLDKPAGFLLLFWPCCWAIILATPGRTINYYALLMFFIGAVALRSSGCIVNDIIDREIDAKVERTRNRPLASGALKLTDAFALLFFMLMAGLFVFMQIDTNAKLYSLAAFALALIYPFMKRIFGFPQLFLGLVFGSGALVAWAAVAGDIDFAAFLLYAGSIFWVVGYDTIYGHQDKMDDAKIGVRSTALTFGKHNKFIIWACFVFSYVLIAWASCTANMASNAEFYCIPALLHMYWLLNTRDLDKPEDCLNAFKQIAFITGILFSVGLYISKII